MLTLQEVDDVLDRMKGLTIHKDQQEALAGVTARCTPTDLNYLVRLLKHDLRMRARVAVVLRSVPIVQLPVGFVLRSVPIVQFLSSSSYRSVTGGFFLRVLFRG